MAAEHGSATVDDVVVLRCFDGEEFRVPSALARRSEAVAAGIDAGEHVATGAVPVPGGVAGRVLAAIIAYWVGCDAVGAAGRGRYDEEYVARLSHDVRVDVINAAFHLSERTLFELFAPPVVVACGQLDQATDGIVYPSSSVMKLQARLV